MKTQDLTGAQLDWAVAKCEGIPQFIDSENNIHDEELMDFGCDGDTKLSFSTDWYLAGPIIEREEISTEFRRAEFKDLWIAYKLGQPDEDNPQGGPTPLIAAMRAYVMAKLGDEINIPEELK